MTAPETMTDRLAALADELGQSVEAVAEAWSECAAVREFDGSMPRTEAERAAFDDVAATLRAARRGPRSAPAKAADEALGRKRTT